MKYLLSQIFIFILSVIVLLYLSRLPGFTPFSQVGVIDWTNVGLIMFFLFLTAESIISVLIYLVEKFLAYGRKEFPSSRFSFKWGLGISLGLIILLFLHINHLITFPWALIVFVALLVIIFIV